MNDIDVKLECLRLAHGNIPKALEMVDFVMGRDKKNPPVSLEEEFRLQDAVLEGDESK